MVKYVCAIFLFFQSMSFSFGQKFEWFVNLNSGLFKYKNVNPGFQNQINIGLGNAYTNDPYSDKSGFPIGLSVTVHKVNRQNMLFGIDLGIESLESKQEITKVYGPVYSNLRQAKGETYYRTPFVNLFSFLGYQLKQKTFNLNLKLGTDIAVSVWNSTDKGSVTIIPNDSLVSINYKSHEGVDFRLRCQADIAFKKVGGYIGYSYGLWNGHTSSGGSSSREIYTRYFRVGLFYKIK